MRAKCTCRQNDAWSQLLLDFINFFIIIKRTPVIREILISAWKIAVIPGDGIGVEIIPEGIRVLDYTLGYLDQYGIQERPFFRERSVMGMKRFTGRLPGAVIAQSERGNGNWSPPQLMIPGSSMT